HNEQAQPRALDLARGRAVHTIKAFEDALELGPRDAHAVVAHAQHHAVNVGRQHIDNDRWLAAGILHRVFDQVGDGRAQLFRIADQRKGFRGLGAKPQGIWGEPVAKAGQLQAVMNDRREVHVLPVAARAALADLARAQHLLYRSQEAVRVIQHQPVEIAALVLIQTASLQRLQVETDGGDRRFQFMSDRVQEAVLLLVSADFPDQKDRVQDQAGDDQAEKDYAQYQRDRVGPVMDNPTDVEIERHGHQAGAQRDEK